MTAEAVGEPTGPQHLVTRLARIEGQVRGIARMVDEDRSSIDVLTQISAAQAALKKVALALVDEHVRDIVCGGAPGNHDEQLSELVSAVGRLRSHSSASRTLAGSRATTSTYCDDARAAADRSADPPRASIG